MAIQNTHPLYDAMQGVWRKMRDVYAGQATVKSRGFEHLPPTAGMVLDGIQSGQPGLTSYAGYLARAVFYEFTTEAVEKAIGVMWQKPPVINLPESMEALRERASNTGEGLTGLLRRINEQQLVAGRLGLMVDLPEAPPPGVIPTPYISLYEAESIRNWDDGATSPDTDKQTSMNLVVLNESGPVRMKDLSWQQVEQYRVLRLGPIDTNEPANAGFPYEQTLVVVSAPTDSGIGETGDGSNLDAQLWTQPSRAGVTLDQVPFVMINTKDLTSKPDKPPFQDLAELCLSIYRADADYRQHLHMQSQDTLVIIGARGGSIPGQDSAWRTGSGATIELDMNGDAKYIGVNSQGLAEERNALENDKQLATNRAGSLMDLRSGQKESGEALSQRVVAQTASINQIAITGAAGLQAALRIIATWMGENPEDVTVEPNLEFGDFDLTGQDLTQIMSAKNSGLPLSNESIHAVLVDRGYTKFSYEEEMDKLADEEPLLPKGTLAGGPAVSGNVNLQNQPGTSGGNLEGDE